MSSKLLIIEDDQNSARKLQKKIKSFGYPLPHVILGNDVSSRLIDEVLPDLILINARLKTSINCVYARSSLNKRSFTPIVCLTDKARKQPEKTNSQPDSLVYLAKPFKDKELRFVIENTLRKYNTEKKLIRINNILYSIRRINHLISRSKNKEQLLKACCKDLVKIRGYIYVCMLLLDTNQNTVFCISAGVERVKYKVEKMIKQNTLPPCYRKALNNTDVFLIKKPSSECGRCFLQSKYAGSLGMSIRLQYRDSVYGVLKITVQRKSIIEDEEKELLKRLASDIAFAFNKLDLEREQQRFIARLQQSEKKFRCLLESLNEGIWVIDNSLVSTYVNPRMAEILGYPIEEIIGKRIVTFLEQGQEDRWNQVVNGNSREIKQQHIFKLLKKDGSVIYTRITVSPLINSKGMYEGAFTGVEDITEQRALERELLELSRKEQERLGQTLHDNLGQLLTGIAFKNKAMEHRLKELHLPDWREARKITVLINRAIEQTRILAKGLVYFKLEPDSFISGINELITNTENIFTVKCRLKCNGPIEIRDSIIAVQLYMIIQEAIHNAVKHGEATEIKISIVCRGKNIILEVIDNGTGRLEHLSKGKGLGLRIMRYRAHMLNASLDFFQNCDRGLRLRCVLID